MTEDVEWFMGFLRTVKLKTTYELYDRDDAISFSDALRDLLALPSAQFMQDFRLGLENYKKNDYGSSLGAMAERKMGCLRKSLCG